MTRPELRIQPGGEELTLDALTVHRKITREGLVISPAWLELDSSDTDLSQHFLTHYVAYTDNEPIGFGLVRQIPDEGNNAGQYDIEIDRFGIVEAQRHQGFGQLLMTRILGEYMAEPNVRLAFLKSPSQFGDFYEKLGFISTGDFHDNDPPYINMYRPLRPQVGSHKIATYNF